MIKNICPTCQTEKVLIDAWRESYTVVILLRCECKDWPVRVENERFNKGETKMITTSVDKEDYAFKLLNQLSDDYGIFDDGSFAQAIWNASSDIELQRVIDILQNHLLEAMRQIAMSFSR